MPIVNNLLRRALRRYTLSFPLQKGKGRLVESTRRWVAPDQPLISTVGDGYKMQLNLRDLIQRSIYFYGYYEPHFSRFLMKVLKGGETFIDCGANIGQFSLIASRCVGSSGKVIAIEPEQHNLDQLKTNLRLNQADNVSVIQAALGNRSGSVDFFLRSEENGFTNRGVHSLHPHGDWLQPQKITVPMKRLDDVLLGERRVDWIKMDIEGAELDALQGAEQSLEQFSPTVFFEANEICTRYFGHGTGAVKRWLFDHGYQLASFQEGHLVKVGNESEEDALIVAVKSKKEDWLRGFLNT